MRQAQRLLSLSPSLFSSLYLSFCLTHSLSLPAPPSFVPRRSVKPIPALRVARGRIIVYEGKRAGSREGGGESSTPILSRRSLSLITHVNTTLQPSKSRRCSPEDLPFDSFIGQCRLDFEIMSYLAISADSSAPKLISN